MGVPDSYTDHVKLMFDLQAIALASEITRVFAFKMSRDVSNRVYPETGVTTGFHNASHHNEREDRIREFAKINKYHVSLLPYFLDRLKRTPDGESNLLDNSLIIYGSSMANPNLHNHKRCPLLFLGKGGGALTGGLHLKGANGTPMANAFLSAMHGIGLDRRHDVRRQHRPVRPQHRPGGDRRGGRSRRHVMIRRVLGGVAAAFALAAIVSAASDPISVADAAGLRDAEGQGIASARLAEARGVSVAEAAMTGDRAAVTGPAQAGLGRERHAGRRRHGVALGRQAGRSRDDAHADHGRRERARDDAHGGLHAAAPRRRARQRRRHRGAGQGGRRCEREDPHRRDAADVRGRVRRHRRR